MNVFSRVSIRYPLRTLAAAALVTLAAAPGLTRLDLQTEGQALAPSRDPAVVHDREVRRLFGVRDSMVAVVRTEHPDGIFNPGTLRRLRDLTAAFERLDGIGPADVTSLATEPGFHFRPGTLERSPLLELLPETPGAIAELRRDVSRIGLYDGLLVSTDGAATAVLVGVPPGADRQAFYREVQRIASAQDLGRDRVEVLGAPVAETLLGIHILADLGVPARWLGGPMGEERRGPGLIPLALTVMGLVFLLGFRRPAAALLPLLKLGVCLVVVFGLMGWLCVPVYLTTAVLPVILIAVGMTGEVLSRLKALGRRRPGASFSGGFSGGGAEAVVFLGGERHRERRLPAPLLAADRGLARVSRLSSARKPPSSAAAEPPRSSGSSRALGRVSPTSCAWSRCPCRPTSGGSGTWKISWRSFREWAGCWGRRGS